MGGTPAGASRIMAGVLCLASVFAFLVCLDCHPAQAVAGDLDPTFGVAGKALPAITGASSITVRAVAVQSDRKIVCLGDYRHSSTGNQDFVLFRLLENGSLDTSFGSGGWVVTDFGGCDWAKDLVILDDGRIVAVGGLEPTCGHEDDYQGLIARYHSNGSLDAAFSGDGRMMSGEGSDFFWNAAAVQEDGRLVVVGNHTGQFCVARYTTAGALDAEFGGAGWMIVPLGTESEGADVLVDPYHKIVALGSWNAGVVVDDWNLVVVRLNSYGGSDTTFNGSGAWFADLNANGSERASRLARDTFGDYYVAGTGIDGGYGSNRDVVLARITADGDLDPTFNDGQGWVSYDVAGENMNTLGMILDPVERPILAGYFGYSGEPYSYQAWLLKYADNGRLDRGFGTEGLVTLDDGFIASYAGGVAPYPSYHVICAGKIDSAPLVSRHQLDDHSCRWGATWWWSDPERNDAYILYPNSLTIQATAGQDFSGCIRGDAPLFFRNLPGGDYWTVQTLISAPDRKTDTFTGLMIWNGVVTIGSHAAYIGLGNLDGLLKLAVQAALPGNCDWNVRDATYANSAMAVRIVRAGDQYSFYYSTDGVAWDFFTSINTTTSFSKVGVMAKSWGANSITAQYSYFSVFNQSAHDVVSLLLADH